MRHRRTLHNGFTLIEVMVSLSILLIVGGGATFLSRSVVDARATKEAVFTAALAGQRAALFSQGMKNNAAWGVSFFSDRAVVFQGGSYATRIPQYDETHPHGVVTLSGNTEITFSKLTGLPSGSTTTTYTAGAATQTLTMNQNAVFSY